MVTALVVATGVALAAAQNEMESTAAIDEVRPPGDEPSDEPSVDFVPNEVVVRTEAGEYETRKVDAQTLDAVEKAANNIEKRNPSVEVAGPNLVYRLAGYIPDEGTYFGIPNFYFNYQDWLFAIKAPGAWNYSKGRDIRIGMVDTGWKRDHPDLVNKVYDEYDFVNDDEVADEEGNDYHGTAVAGVAAAETDNGQGVASIGFDAQFVIAEACANDLCETQHTAQAIEWLAEQDVKIINLSFGAVYPNGTGDELLELAIKDAQDAGALVVAGAGSDGVYTDDDPTTSDPAHYPSCFQGVLGVGSIDKAGDPEWYPNTGPCVDLIAPGELVLTTVNWGEGSSSPPYGYVTGTSFSAPQVAGTAALIKARNPGMSADQIAQRLKDQATDMGDDNAYGSGMLNAKCSVYPAARFC
jgi:subtilisin family serine protease